MRGNKLILRLGQVLLTIALLAPCTWAATEKVIFAFDGNNGSSPIAGLIFDRAGNLYGTTLGGGNGDDKGTVFELSPDGSGGWTHRVLHRFTGNDGERPYAGVIFDAAGNLYGTTSGGGNSSSGTVFKLSHNGSGGWTETVLHHFSNVPDGDFPAAGLIFDGAGHLYGTTKFGGKLGHGTVFQLSPNGSGWTEKVLHYFGNDGAVRDGQRPEAGVILDAAGNLYGTTSAGGRFVGGTVFQLTPGAGGLWTETVLFNASVPDGPIRSTLIFDSAGDLYGNLTGSDEFSPRGRGMVFRLNRNEGWSETVLHTFISGPTDGLFPKAGLVFGPDGSLYGTTSAGGRHLLGTAFVLEPNPQGGYTERLLHSFTGSRGADGTAPEAVLVRDAAGNLYGTTRHGGPHGRGTVFEITP